MTNWGPETTYKSPTNSAGLGITTTDSFTWSEPPVSQSRSTTDTMTVTNRRLITSNKSCLSFMGSLHTYIEVKKANIEKDQLDHLTYGGWSLSLSVSPQSYKWTKRLNFFCFLFF